MDELSEDDKLTVARARKIQRFLSQPFQVAEVFTGTEGKLVPLKDTIRGFKMILNGKSDLWCQWKLRNVQKQIQKFAVRCRKVLAMFWTPNMSFRV